MSVIALTVYAGLEGKLWHKTAWWESASNRSFRCNSFTILRTTLAERSTINPRCRLESLPSNDVFSAIIFITWIIIYYVGNLPKGQKSIFVPVTSPRFSSRSHPPSAAAIVLEPRHKFISRATRTSSSPFTLDFSHRVDGERLVCPVTRLLPGEGLEIQ